jgi:hypothetical protein
MNYTEGDSMKYIDQDDVNATADLALDLFKTLVFDEKKADKDYSIIYIIMVLIIILIALLIFQRKK